jgi:hypothetical protein
MIKNLKRFSFQVLSSAQELKGKIEAAQHTDLVAWHGRIVVLIAAATAGLVVVFFAKATEYAIDLFFSMQSQYCGYL